jgi:hypothetical protein
MEHVKGWWDVPVEFKNNHPRPLLNNQVIELQKRRSRDGQIGISVRYHDLEVEIKTIEEAAQDQIKAEVSHERISGNTKGCDRCLHGGVTHKYPREQVGNPGRPDRPISASPKGD